MSPRFIIIGGGFFGISLALFFRSLTDKVTLIERSHSLMSGASFANQARIHTGFHYPRSFATAKRSLMLHRRFIDDFAPAVVDDFQMLYAVARDGSRVPASRFESMFTQMGAPIRPANDAQRGLFDSRLIEAVFQCDEAAFNALILRDMLSERLERANVDIRFGTEATAIRRRSAGLVVEIRDGASLTADYVFNATYSRLNHIDTGDETECLPIKNEIAEIALVTPPEPLRHLGITVVDGPFFSIMPFPARNCYSLTHVRYTPQFAWTYRNGPIPPESAILHPQSHWVQMVRDAARYLPCVADTDWLTSLFVTKAVLEKNEIDDGRPIFIHRSHKQDGLFSVMGAKIDNIYDMFAELGNLSMDFSSANTRWMFGGGAV